MDFSKTQRLYLSAYGLICFNVLYTTCLIIGYFSTVININGGNNEIVELFTNILDQLFGVVNVAHYKDYLIRRAGTETQNLLNRPIIGKSLIKSLYVHKIIFKSLFLPAVISLISGILLSRMLSNRDLSGKDKIKFQTAMWFSFVNTFLTLLIMAIVYRLGIQFFNQRWIINILMVLLFGISIVPLVLISLVKE